MITLKAVYVLLQDFCTLRPSSRNVTANLFPTVRDTSAMATIPRVDSTASELNDFQETKEGKKIYNVRHCEIYASMCLSLLFLSLKLRELLARSYF
jgi:hypothetical protein